MRRSISFQAGRLDALNRRAILSSVTELHWSAQKFAEFAVCSLRHTANSVFLRVSKPAAALAPHFALSLSLSLCNRLAVVLGLKLSVLLCSNNVWRTGEVDACYTLVTDGRIDSTANSFTQQADT